MSLKASIRNSLKRGFAVSLFLFISTFSIDAHAITCQYFRPGDFNQDRARNIEDLKILSDAVKNGDKQVMFDINIDFEIDCTDIITWISCVKGTTYGDVNLDGVFDTEDFRIMFENGLYDINDGSAWWGNGDMNCDGNFDNQDLLIMFQEGAYTSDV